MSFGKSFSKKADKIFMLQNKLNILSTKKKIDGCIIIYNSILEIQILFINKTFS